MLTCTRKAFSTIITVAVLIFIGLSILGALNRAGEQKVHDDTVRITNCYAHVMETHTGTTTEDLADAMRGYGRCS